MLLPKDNFLWGWNAFANSVDAWKEDTFIPVASVSYMHQFIDYIVKKGGEDGDGRVTELADRFVKKFNDEIFPNVKGWSQHWKLWNNQNDQYALQFKPTPDLLRTGV